MATKHYISLFLFEVVYSILECIECFCLFYLIWEAVPGIYNSLGPKVFPKFFLPPLASFDVHEPRRLSCCFRRWTIFPLPGHGEPEAWIHTVHPVEDSVGLDEISSSSSLFHCCHPCFSKLLFVCFASEIGDHPNSSSLDFLHHLFVSLCPWTPSTGAIIQ